MELGLSSMIAASHLQLPSSSLWKPTYRHSSITGVAPAVSQKAHWLQLLWRKFELVLEGFF